MKSLTNCRAPKQKIGDPDPLRFASKPDVFTRALQDRHDTGLSVENINDRTREFRNIIRGSARGEAN